MFDMYIKHGRIFGGVQLLHPTKEEETAISNFFGRDYYNQALIRIGLADFERQLQKNISPDAKLSVLLEEYIHDAINNKSVNAPDSADAFASYITHKLMSDFKNTRAEIWLREVLTHARRSYKYWIERIINRPKDAHDAFAAVCMALNHLPEENLTPPMLLSDFSRKVTGSPYALAFYGEYGTLFLRGLACVFDEKFTNRVENSTALYLRAGLLSQGVISQVMVHGLKAKSTENENDAVCVLYNKLNESHILTLERVSQFGKIKAYGSDVFIIENPLLYSAVVEIMKSENANLNYTLICPIGNSDAAFLRLLELGAQSAGSVLYYSGNMDCSGLIRADSLFMKFGRKFKPWRYSKEDYDFIIESGGALNDYKDKINALHNDTLAALLSHMKKTGKTADTMALAKTLANDIKRMQGG